MLIIIVAIMLINTIAIVIAGRAILSEVRKDDDGQAPALRRRSVLRLQRLPKVPRHASDLMPIIAFAPTPAPAAPRPR